jgi:hypothetical protein
MNLTRVSKIEVRLMDATSELESNPLDYGTYTRKRKVKGLSKGCKFSELLHPLTAKSLVA